MPWREILELVPVWILRTAVAGAVALVAIQMWRGDALICPNGAVFAKRCDPVSEGVPNQAVVAFNSAECPPGWRDNDAAKGRFIVGSGRHSEYDQYGRALKVLELGDTGGSRTHKLKDSEMPTHAHEHVSSNGYNSPEHTDTTPTEFGAKNTTERTASAGGDEPHNNMPPFLVLRFCEPAS